MEIIGTTYYSSFAVFEIKVERLSFKRRIVSLIIASYNFASFQVYADIISRQYKKREVNAEVNQIQREMEL